MSRRVRTLALAAVAFTTLGALACSEERPSREVVVVTERGTLDQSHMGGSATTITSGGGGSADACREWCQQNCAIGPGVDYAYCTYDEYSATTATCHVFSTPEQELPDVFTGSCL